MKKRYTILFTGVLALGVLSPIALLQFWNSPSRRASVSSSPRQLLRQVQATVPWYYRWIEAYGVRFHLPRQWVMKAAHADMAADEGRQGAAGRLAALGTNAWRVAPALLDAVARGDMSIGVPAARALAGMNIDQAPHWERLAGRLAGQTRAVRVLEWLVRGSDEWRRPYSLANRRFGLLGLGAVGPAAKPTAPMVVELLKSRDDSGLWPAAVSALVGMKADTPELLSGFKRVLQNPEEWPTTRACAADALTALAPGDPNLRPLLDSALRDTSGLVRAAAARNLWKLHVSPEVVLPVLTALLDHKLVSIRTVALDGLAQMGAAARPSSPLVERLTTDENATIRQAATNALQQIRERPGPSPGTAM